MKKPLLALLLLSVAPAASAQMIVLGEGPAQSCYESAIYGDEGSRSAIKTCSDALDTALTRKDRAATLVNRGILQMRRDVVTPAARDFDQALELMPELPEAHINRGVALFKAGDVDAARMAYDRALEIGTDKHEADALFNRALAHEALDNPRAAYADITAALALRPDWQRAQDFQARFEVRPKTS